jgi:quercetin dioxygenase-like cupin family protein
LILALFERPNGVEAAPGNRVVYDIERDEAHFGAVPVAGPALVWELGEYAGNGAALAATVALDAEREWIMRCDRIDFPPGGVAYRHTHPGPGIRRLLHGSIRIETEGEAHEYGPGAAWFEAGSAPVYAAASATQPTAFVRVMLLPREWEGRRTIRYVDPADEEKPKLQRPTVFFDRPLAL